MYNSANPNNATVKWQSQRKPMERWNRPALESGSSIFWRAIEARRAPRSEFELEQLMPSTRRESGTSEPART
ncbi:MAG: hypothetical protein KC800_31260 [Candidatus Eremiobacteraeota bacterium]|nr:hypothetical protein [Candidatus Eremiobacteraeota bacterium]